MDIRENIKHYQETLSYTSSKVDYNIGKNIYMLPSDIDLNIKSETVGYNNKILIFNDPMMLDTTKFSYPMLRLVWGKF